MEKIIISRDNYAPLCCNNYFAQGLIVELKKRNFPRLNSAEVEFPDGHKMRISSITSEMQRDFYREERHENRTLQHGYAWHYYKTSAKYSRRVWYSVALHGTCMLIDFGGENMYFAS